MEFRTRGVYAQFLQRLRQTVRRMSFSHSLLGLIWTAGPVTALGLYGGYYIGYGKAPSTELLIYFISFTVLSGLIALGAKIVHDSTQAPLRVQAERDLLETIDKLGDLIPAVRDLALDSLDEDGRRREAALQLLQRVDLAPDGVAFACEELTGDPALARTLAHIDTLRRAGLYSRIRDLHQQCADRYEQAAVALREVAPLAATALHERYTGDVPQLQSGVPRGEHFIERVLAAIEADNPLLITMTDVESMLVLAFELINGRELPMLVFSYRGVWRLAAALDRMERERSRYRIAQAAASNRIRALASWLVEVNALTYEDVPEGLPTQMLVERVGAVLDRMSAALDEAYVQVLKGDVARLTQVRQEAQVLTNALRLYRAAYAAYQQVGKAHVEFLKASEAWARLSAQRSASVSALRVGAGRRGLRIEEQSISLDDEQRGAVCAHLANYLRGEHLEKRGRGYYVRRDGQARQLTPDTARQLAVEVALALEPAVHLSQPEVQRGIGATRASYLGDLEPGMSAQEKRRLGEAMAKDVVQDLSQAAEQLALALVRHYRVDLSEAARDFLEVTYGARRSVLDMLAQHQASDAPRQSLLSVRPAVVSSPRLEWYRSLVRARRVLNA